MTEVTELYIYMCIYVGSMKPMETRIRKWGNSLAVRIPQTLARQLGLEPDSPVNITAKDNGLTIQPVRRPAVSLDVLLEGVTADNRHGEVDTGPSTGREAW